MASPRLGTPSSRWGLRPKTAKKTTLVSVKDAKLPPQTAAWFWIWASVPRRMDTSCRPPIGADENSRGTAAICATHSPTVEQGQSAVSHLRKDAGASGNACSANERATQATRRPARWHPPCRTPCRRNAMCPSTRTSPEKWDARTPGIQSLGSGNTRGSHRSCWTSFLSVQ